MSRTLLIRAAANWSGRWSYLQVFSLLTESKFEGKRFTNLIGCDRWHRTQGEFRIHSEFSSVLGKCYQNPRPSPNIVNNISHGYRLYATNLSTVK